MSGFVRRLDPRPAWSAAHLVAMASIALAEPPTVPFAVPVVRPAAPARGRHRAHRKARVVIGESTPPGGLPGRWSR